MGIFVKRQKMIDFIEAQFGTIELPYNLIADEDLQKLRDVAEELGQLRQVRVTHCGMVFPNGRSQSTH